jgi:hypothetical protein
MMHNAIGESGHGLDQAVCVKFPTWPRNADQLATAGHELRTIALIDLNVRVAVAENGATRFPVCCKGERVCSRPCCHKKNCNFPFKQLVELVGDAFGEGVTAVSRRMTIIMAGQRRHHRRSCTRPIVTGKIHGAVKSPRPQPGNRYFLVVHFPLAVLHTK